jgi:hypothetical protein
LARHGLVMATIAKSRRQRKTHIFEKANDGWYVEPSWVSRRLFEVEQFDRRIHDPACGWGTITKEAVAAGYRYVGGSDIVDRRRHGLGPNFSKCDFLECNGSLKGTSIICNPPFDHVLEFCEHALALGATNVAMICLVRRLNAAHWLQALPLRRVYLLSPRPSMPPGSWLAAGNKAGGGTQDFCWLCMESGYTGAPELRWLHRDGGKTEVAGTTRRAHRLEGTTI